MKNSGNKERIKTIISALVWVSVWGIASVAVGEELFLPSPFAAVRALGGLVFTGVFWRSVGASLVRIGGGFFAALVLGVLLAWAAAASRIVELLLRPLMLVVKATPVASFIILALVWLSSRNLSVLISFLMVLPVIYSGTLGGIAAADAGMLEISSVYRVGFWRKVRAVYLPALWPALSTACDVALGLCWKSGVAAEVIGQARYSIGGQLYTAKIHLLTPELFAWTAVIIVMSWLFGRVVIALLHMLHRAVRGRWVRG